MYFYINLISYLGANILWDTAPRDIWLGTIIGMESAPTATWRINVLYEGQRPHQTYW